MVKQYYFSHFVDNILWLLLALQVKVASFVDKYLWSELHENHEYFVPQKLPAVR